MSEQTAESAPAEDSEDTSTSSAPVHPYPARDADNGEEQKNRLGYMVTEPTEEEIEGDEDGESEKD